LYDLNWRLENPDLITYSGAWSFIFCLPRIGSDSGEDRKKKKRTGNKKANDGLSKINYIWYSIDVIHSCCWEASREEEKKTVYETKVCWIRHYISVQYKKNVKIVTSVLMNKQLRVCGGQIRGVRYRIVGQKWSELNRIECIYKQVGLTKRSGRYKQD
jgi:hypothetical protein